MKDRFMNGYVAGVVADIPIVILDMLSGLFHLDKFDYIHFVTIFAFSERNPNIWETLFALMIQLFFAGVLGVAFSYLLPHISERYFYSKGLIWGVLVWFMIYAVDIIFKIEDGLKMDFRTAVTHFILSVIWGWLMAWMLKRLRRMEQR
ncbi:hypothetical protein EDC14_101654 [Hydrogenispora ethanolica]|uniref:Uncharacterized protein n=1 Tax=Hydrogenispora ethanolica TaxID=1082276 RepID=A0A4R1RIK0_HYDET|nr:hypothetical protein [Hydrogenispora ethanolica]TCL65924.1 hypothetical protein EDC14_101654 [Hydrogenispora ethanolica]